METKLRNVAQKLGQDAEGYVQAVLMRQITADESRTDREWLVRNLNAPRKTQCFCRICTKNRRPSSKHLKCNPVQSKIMADNSETISVVETILLRPKMYTLSGTFGEVVAFLEGYYSGMTQSSANAASAPDWEAFRAWLAERSGIEATGGFLTFQQTNAQAVVKQLSEWLAEFQESIAAE